jgi:predicted ATP-dependent Lon-type protease
MLKHCDLFDDLPEQYHDSAFLDRLHFYLAEILRNLAYVCCVIQV